MALTNRTRPIPRYGTAAGTGTLATLVLVGVCGSPAYVEWAGSATDATSAAGWFLRLLAWPAWSFDTAEPVAANLRAVLLVVLAAVFLWLLPASQVARVPGSASQFFTGWAAYALAGGLASLLAAFAAADPSMLLALQSAGTGATYGFLAGWIIGTASLGGRA
ncbi:hypothetical protein [Micromonospora endolithica]|uniref:Uncharacterized protein n=1 Tax=Micromonospora endolithica TaxID=230091 RepID=A0A3A9Z362_9ACTN|nr:hypothetical protein [Micromonospora endolithica]RKN42713.1 hypothetical protein D7223_22010 [Micromonospora endolithica]TWJ25444.1 hypothetical protein JD76_05615 [Micromonospora endolithica]